METKKAKTAYSSFLLFVFFGSIVKSNPSRDISYSTNAGHRSSTRNHEEQVRWHLPTEAREGMVVIRQPVALRNNISSFVKIDKTCTASRLEYYDISRKGWQRSLKEFPAGRMAGSKGDNSKTSLLCSLMSCETPKPWDSEIYPARLRLRIDSFIPIWTAPDLLGNTTTLSSRPPEKTMWIVLRNLGRTRTRPKDHSRRRRRFYEDSQSLPSSRSWPD